jgi:hypothetical protein
MIHKVNDHFEVFFTNKLYRIAEQFNLQDENNCEEVIILNSNFINTIGYLKIKPSSNNELISYVRADTIENNTLRFDDFILTKAGASGLLYDHLYVEGVYKPQKLNSILNFPIKLSSNIENEILVIRKKVVEGGLKFKTPILSSFYYVILDSISVKLVDIMQNENTDSDKIQLIKNLNFNLCDIDEQRKILSKALNLAEEQVNLINMANLYSNKKKEYLSNLQPK